MRPPGDTHEDWLACPRCGCTRFTIAGTEYGIELACFRCPTYLGARTPHPVHVLGTGPELARTHRFTRWRSRVWRHQPRAA